jgi:hypothetical protein
MVRRLMSCIIGASTLLVLGAAPALAHTRAGAASDWRSVLTTVPHVEGLEWRLYPAGEYLFLENTGDLPVVIFGYEGEPFLRVGPKGVEQNANSPTTYLSRRRDGDVALPPRADATRAAEWESISPDSSYSWYDHRAHRMPDDTRGDHSTWSVPFESGGERFQLEGELTFDPGPPWWRWIGFGALASVAALWGIRKDGRRERLLPAAITVASVATFNLLHLPDEILALPSTIFDVAFGLGHNVLFIGTGMVGAYLSVRPGRPSGLALGIGSGAVAFHQGFLQVGQLGASQLPTAWPPSMIRFAVGVSVAQFLWVILLLAADRRAQAAEGPDLIDTAGSLMLRSPDQMAAHDGSHF